MTRNPRSAADRRPNPLRDLVAEKQRATEIARERQRAERLKQDLPEIIDTQVGEHIQKLETKLLKDFKEMGKRAVEESTNVLNETLAERIETLEHISELQSKTIVSLRDSSKAAEQKVSSVVNSIEKTLSNAVPGFKLEPSAFAAPLIEAQPPVHAGEVAVAELAGTEMIKADPVELTEAAGKYGFCPKCTSTKIRRANRSGIWEEFLRLFFIAPFRCRACRHKFYRF